MIINNKTDPQQVHPIICAVETPYTLSFGETDNQCRLFSGAGKNNTDRFYLVTPRGYIMGDSVEAAKKIISAHRIDGVELPVFVKENEYRGTLHG